jgi:hypothetical protein
VKEEMAVGRRRTWKGIIHVEEIFQTMTDHYNAIPEAAIQDLILVGYLIQVNVVILMILVV